MENCSSLPLQQAVEAKRGEPRFRQACQQIALNGFWRLTSPIKTNDFPHRRDKINQVFSQIKIVWVERAPGSSRRNSRQMWPETRGRHPGKNSAPTGSRPDINVLLSEYLCFYPSLSLACQFFVRFPSSACHTEVQWEESELQSSLSLAIMLAV